MLYNSVRKLLAWTKKRDRSHGGEATTNQKETLDGRKIRTTAVSRTVREIPFGIDKLDGSHAQLTR